jgi:hypothetical protein
MLKQLGAAALMAAATLSQAQTASAPASAAKKELVAKILQLQQPGIEEMARQLTSQPAMRLMQQVAPTVQALPAERREAVARDIEADVRKFVDEATPIVRDRALKLAPSTIGAVLEEKMTEDELRQVIAILESPANRKFQQLGAEMQRALGEKLIAETRGEIEPKVTAMAQTVAKRLPATPPAAASTPAAKPAASAATKK